MVSIIVPVYNVEEYLRVCIDSILLQTYRNIEVILVDDGSTDQSGKICDSYTDPRISVFHTNNHGLSAARNLGIDHSHGEYICFIDSDDWIDNDVIEKAVENIGSADILCYGANTATYTGYEALVAHINGKIGVTAWNKLYKRSCFANIRFPVGRIMEDMATTFKLLHHAERVICIDYNGYHYRNRKDSISNTRDLTNIVDYWKACKERYEYCINIIIYEDETTHINLLKSCAYAISRSWGWRWSMDTSDSMAWNEMSNFARTKFPLYVRRKFPIRIQGGLFLARYNKPWAFWCAHKAHMLTRNIHVR